MNIHDREHRCEYAVDDDDDPASAVCVHGWCSGRVYDAMFGDEVACSCSCHRRGRVLRLVLGGELARVFVCSWRGHVLTENAGGLRCRRCSPRI